MPFDRETRDFYESVKVNGQINKESIWISDYHKCRFTIEFEMRSDKDKDLDGRWFAIECGGTTSLIEHFDPYEGWKEWEKAGILDFYETEDEDEDEDEEDN